MTGDPNYMASLARGLEVMRGFSRERRQMSIAQLSQKTGIPRASVRRCLYTLAQLGYVASEDGRHYSLRPKVLGLGHAYLSSTPLVVAAQPGRCLRQRSYRLGQRCLACGSNRCILVL